jgi:hypothetical protein
VDLYLHYQNAFMACEGPTLPYNNFYCLLGLRRVLRKLLLEHMCVYGVCKCILDCLEAALCSNSELKFIFLYELEFIPVAKISFTIFCIRHRVVWYVATITVFCIKRRAFWYVATITVCERVLTQT